MADERSRAAGGMVAGLVVPALLVLGGLAALAMILRWTPPIQVDAAVQTPTSYGIAVSGEGRVSVRPDIALINLGVEVTAPTVAEAREQAAAAMTAVQDAVRAQGVEERDVQTRYFNIYPQYSYPEREAPQVVGFVVSNTVEVKVRDVDTASDVLDAAVAAGGNAVRVHGISFSVDRPAEHRTEARQEAVEQARANAEVLAAAAGVTLGDPISIVESTGGYVPGPFPERAAMDGVGGATPVSPGEQEVTVVVSVVFAIR